MPIDLAILFYHCVESFRNGISNLARRKATDILPIQGSVGLSFHGEKPSRKGRGWFRYETTAKHKEEETNKEEKGKRNKEEKLRKRKKNF